MVVSRYSPAASGTKAAITIVRYGRTRVSQPTAPPGWAAVGAPADAVPAGLVALVAPGAPGAAANRRASRTAAQLTSASSANRPRNTAPCVLNGLGPASRRLPSGTPSS